MAAFRACTSALYLELRSPAGMEREEVVPSERRMLAPLPPFLTAFSGEPSVKTWVQVPLG